MNIKYTLFSALLILAGCASTQSAKAATLKIVVDGVSKTNGTVTASLFNNEAGWLKTGIKNNNTKPVVPSTELVFTDVQPGDYAVYVHDDVNGNGVLDKSWFGKPKEPYGFSNDSGHMFGPAKWNEAKFTVADKDVVIHIHVK